MGCQNDSYDRFCRPDLKTAPNSWTGSYDVRKPAEDRKDNRSQGGEGEHRPRPWPPVVTTHASAAVGGEGRRGRPSVNDRLPLSQIHGPDEPELEFRAAIAGLLKAACRPFEGAHHVLRQTPVM